MSTTKFIKFFDYRKAGVIQLNRPAALNAINLEMWKNMYELLWKMESQKDLVIVKGSGNIFCAGGDIKQMTSSTPDNANFVYNLVCKSFDLIANYKKPYAVLFDGLAMGGAATYSMPAKYRIATERTAFSMPETAIGYFNDCGASYFLSRLDNNLGVQFSSSESQHRFCFSEQSRWLLLSSTQFDFDFYTAIRVVIITRLIDCGYSLALYIKPFRKYLTST